MLLIASTALAGPDCLERKVSIQDLQALVDSGKIKTQQDFLAALPEGSLQNFTFVTNSLSLHRGNEKSDENGQGKVTPLWPRVLRSTADGKITISFVCDPKNPSYGKVEVLFFDDSGEKINSVEWDFGNSLAQHPGHTTLSPKSCIGCHSGSTVNGEASLKFNWRKYFQWGDCQRDRNTTLYGSSDDNMQPATQSSTRLADAREFAPSCHDDDYRKARKDEVEDYKKFRELQKNNDCFNTLPWPKTPEGTASIEGNNLFFPYIGNPADFNGQYHRPNLRMTTNYAHWMARRLFQLLKQGNAKNYKLLKYYLAMESVGCDLPDEDKIRIQKLTGVNVDGPNLRGNYHTPEETPLLYNASLAAGLSGKDWTMEFRSQKPEYETGRAEINQMVEGLILKDLSSENPAISEVTKNHLDSQSPIVKYDDEENFRCVDEIAPVPKSNAIPYVGKDMDRSMQEHDAYCALLHSENEKYLDQVVPLLTQRLAVSCPDEPLPQNAPIPQLANSVGRIMEKLDLASIARGRKLVQPDSKGKCVICHSAGAKSALPPDFRFVPNEKASNKEFAESLAVLKARQQEGFSSTLQVMLIESKAMPPIKNTLTDQERGDIAAYILSLAH